MLSELGEFRPGKRRQSDGIRSDSGSHQHESWMDGNVGRSCWDTYTRNTRCLVGNDGNLENGGKCQCGSESCRMIEGRRIFVESKKCSQSQSNSKGEVPFPMIHFQDQCELRTQPYQVASSRLTRPWWHRSQCQMAKCFWEGRLWAVWYGSKDDRHSSQGWSEGSCG